MKTVRKRTRYLGRRSRVSRVPRETWKRKRYLGASTSRTAGDMDSFPGASNPKPEHGREVTALENRKKVSVDKTGEKAIKYF